MSTHLILYVPGEVLHSNFENLAAETKKKVQEAFIANHTDKPLQVGYNGGVEVGTCIGGRINALGAGLVIEWIEGLEVVHLQDGAWNG